MIYIYTVGFYFILMFLSTNIIGFVVNGFYDPILDWRHEMSESRLIERSKMNVTQMKTVAYIFLIIAVVYLCSIYFMLNAGLAIVALAFMLTRIPDVRYEIRTNTKLNRKNMPKNFINTITTIIDWLLLPCIYFSLKYLEISTHLIKIN